MTEHRNRLHKTITRLNYYLTFFCFETKNNYKLGAPDVLPKFALSSYTFLCKKKKKYIIITYTYTTFGGDSYKITAFTTNRFLSITVMIIIIMLTQYILSLFLSIINIIHHVYYVAILYIYIHAYYILY